MGYSTSFCLSVMTEAPDDIFEQLRDEYEGAAYCLTNSGDGNESGKWYSHQEDLKDFSKKHPDVLFRLEGEGEEAGDMWKFYVQNGKSQLCKAIITYPPFDRAKLA